jgi:hypothetical protein
MALNTPLVMAVALKLPARPCDCHVTDVPPDLFKTRLQGSGVMGPGGLDPQAARARQQLVPAPERIWALRNVANSMLRSTASSGGGGSSSSSTPSAEEAVSMLKSASDLAAEHYGMSHPGGSCCCRPGRDFRERQITYVIQVCNSTIHSPGSHCAFCDVDHAASAGFIATAIAVALATGPAGAS